MKKRGFTLAEVLISLGIIGVVSAITMPALTANYQKKTYEAAAKKAYNTVSVAIQTYMAQEGVDDLKDSEIYTSNSSETWEKFANNYFKVAQVCVTGSGQICPSDSSTNKSRCFVSQYKNMAREENGLNMNGVYLSHGMVITLTDGTSFIMSKTSSDTNAFTVTFDTNGINGPNIVGRDLFRADIKFDGLVYDEDWQMNYANNPDGWYTNYKNLKTKRVAQLPGIGKLMSDGWQMNY